MFRFLPRIARRAGSTVRQAAGGLADLVLPPTCPLCSHSIASGRVFCGACLSELLFSRRFMENACRRCGRPAVRTGVGVSTDEDSTRPDCCPTCESAKSWHIDQTIATLAYEGRVREAIVAAKFASAAPLAHGLTRICWPFIARRLSQPWPDDRPPDVVTFVPSFWTRRMNRGGCSAEIFAQGMAEWAKAGNLNLRFEPILRARRRIAKQAWLRDAERISNVQDAFGLRKSYARLAGRHVLVVDDVMTSGATTNEVARVLRQAGARHVSVAVVARAIPH